MSRLTLKARVEVAQVDAHGRVGKRRQRPREQLLRRLRWPNVVVRILRPRVARAAEVNGGRVAISDCASVAAIGIFRNVNVHVERQIVFQARMRRYLTRLVAHPHSVALELFLGLVEDALRQHPLALLPACQQQQQ